MGSKYPRIYRALKQYGFSPYKAIEMMIDAKRRDQHALTFIKIVTAATRKEADHARS